MLEPPIPHNEVERIEALHALGVLDTPRDAGIDSLTRHLSRLWHAPITAVSLIDRDRQWFKSQIGLDVSQTPRSVSFCAHMLTQPDDPLVVHDALLDARFFDNPLVVGDPKIRFYAGSALRDDAGNVLGALCVIDRRPRRRTPAKVQALKELATAVSGALVLHRSVHVLERLSTHDPLTGALNRKGLDAYLAATESAPAALLLLDLDGFKVINDTFGHAAGDAALCEVVHRVRGVVRPDDALARLGGDEFAIVLGDCHCPEDAMGVAGRIHALLAHPFDVGGAPAVLATSIGIACRPFHATLRAALFAKADAALYVAKASGRATTRMAIGGGGYCDRHASRAA